MIHTRYVIIFLRTFWYNCHFIRLWNNLNLMIRNVPTIESYKRALEGPLDERALGLEGHWIKEP
jgi:hypothetical protein